MGAIRVTDTLVSSRPGRTWVGGPRIPRDLAVACSLVKVRDTVCYERELQPLSSTFQQFTVGTAPGLIGISFVDFV